LEELEEVLQNHSRRNRLDRRHFVVEDLSLDRRTTASRSVRGSAKSTIVNLRLRLHFREKVERMAEPRSRGRIGRTFEVGAEPTTSVAASRPFGVPGMRPLSLMAINQKLGSP
jgi:hypothetical protein